MHQKNVHTTSSSCSARRSLVLAHAFALSDSECLTISCLPSRVIWPLWTCWTFVGVPLCQVRLMERATGSRELVHLSPARWDYSHDTASVAVQHLSCDIRYGSALYKRLVLVVLQAQSFAAPNNTAATCRLSVASCCNIRFATACF